VEVKFKNNGFTEEDFLKDDSLKAIAFQYIVPLPFVKPLRFWSKINIVDSTHEEALRKRFNRRNALLSLLGLPFSPFFAGMAKRNNREGLDHSIDFRSNLESGDFSKGIIEIKQIKQVFMKPQKSVIKGVEKAFVEFYQNHGAEILPIVVAESVFGNDCQYMIGIPNNLMHQKSEIKACLSKQFLKHIEFELYNLDSNEGPGELLLEQGVKVNLK
jgi:hypothetical protein